MSDNDRLAYLYKECEITSYSTPVKVGDSIWPRPAIKTTITHSSGISVVLFNIHLKCCGGTTNFNHRKEASEIALEAAAVVSQLKERDTKLAHEVNTYWGEISNTET